MKLKRQAQQYCVWDPHVWRLKTPSCRDKKLDGVVRGDDTASPTTTPFRLAFPYLRGQQAACGVGAHGKWCNGREGTTYARRASRSGQREGTLAHATPRPSCELVSRHQQWGLQHVDVRLS